MKQTCLLILLTLLAGCAKQDSRTANRQVTTADLASDIKVGQLDRLNRALLADPKGEIEDDGETNLLTVAIQANNEQAVNMLLIHGASPDGSRYTWDTPLVIAVKKDDLKLADMLLDFGADPDKATPLEYVANTDNGRKIAALLVKKRADLNRRTRNNGYLLQSAIQKGEWCVKLLLELGADPNGPEDAYSSPLELANEKKAASIARLLIQYGAESKARKHGPYLKLLENQESVMAILRKWEAQHGK